MVTTRMSEAVPITIPSEVSKNRVRLLRKVSIATLSVSLRTSFG